MQWLGRPLLFAAALYLVLLGCNRQQKEDEEEDNLPDDGGPGLRVGTRAPQITGQDQDGKVFSLSDYRGKVVLLDFWSTT